MARSLGELKVKIGADTRELDRNLTGAQSRIQNFRRIATRAATAFAIALPAAFAAAGGAAFKMTRDLGNAADKLLDMEQQTGLSTDALQEFQNVARVAGVSTTALSGAAEGLTRRLRVSGEDSKEFTDNIRALGVNVRNADGSLRSMDELMPEIITRLQGMTDITTRNAIAMQLFGRRATELAPVLGMTAEQFEAARREAHEMGQVLDRETLVAANEFRISVEQLQAKISLAVREITASMLPAMQRLADFFEDTILPKVQEAAGAISGFFEAMSDPDGGTAAFETNVGRMVVGLAQFGAAINAVSAGFLSFMNFVLGGTAAIGAALGDLSVQLSPLKELSEALVDLQNPRTIARGFERLRAFDFGSLGGIDFGQTMEQARSASSGYFETANRLSEAAFGSLQFIANPLEAIQEFLAGNAATRNAINNPIGGGSGTGSGSGAGAGATDAAATLEAYGTRIDNAIDALIEDLVLRTLFSMERNPRIAQDDAITRALGGTGGTTEDPRRIPVALDFQNRRDQAIADALGGPAGRGVTDNVFRLTTVFTPRELKDQAIFDALSGSGGASESEARIPVAWDWQDRQDQAIADALGGPAGRGTTDNVFRITTVFTPRELKDQAIFDALAGTGGLTENPLRIPVAVDWQSRQDEAIFAALAGVPGAGVTDNVWRAPVSPERVAQDAAIFRELESRGGVSDPGLTAEEMRDWREWRENRDDEDAESGTPGWVTQLKDAGLSLVSSFQGIGAAVQALVAGSGPIAALIAFIADLLKNTESFGEIIRMVGVAMEPIVNVLDSLLQALMPVIEPLLQLNAALAPFIEIATKILTPVFKALGAVLSVLVQIVGAVVNTLIGIYNVLLGWLFGKIDPVDLNMDLRKTEENTESEREGGLFGTGEERPTSQLSLNVSRASGTPAVSTQLIDAGNLFENAAVQFSQGVADFRDLVRKPSDASRALA